MYVCLKTGLTGFVCVVQYAEVSEFQLSKTPLYLKPHILFIIRYNEEKKGESGHTSTDSSPRLIQSTPAVLIQAILVMLDRDVTAHGNEVLT